MRVQQTVNSVQLRHQCSTNSLAMEFVSLVREGVDGQLRSSEASVTQDRFGEGRGADASGDGS